MSLWGKIKKVGKTILRSPLAQAVPGLSQVATAYQQYDAAKGSTKRRLTKIALPQGGNVIPIFNSTARFAAAATVPSLLRQGSKVIETVRNKAGQYIAADTMVIKRRRRSRGITARDLRQTRRVIRLMRDINEVCKEPVHHRRRAR